MAKRSRLTQRDKRKLAIEMGVEVQQRDSSYQRKAGGGYNLDKFQLTENQQKIEDSIYQYDATVVQGSAGVGKTSVAIRTALKLLKEHLATSVQALGLLGIQIVQLILGHLADPIAVVKTLFPNYAS